MTGVRRTTWDALRARRRPLGRLAAWSVAESLPALLSGLIVARAVDRGFLAGEFGTGLAWLAGLAVAVLVGAVATGRVYRSLGAVVEPYRDELAARVVDGALREATRAGGRPDSAAVARLTQQVEVVRDTFGGLLLVVRGFLFSAGAALLGLLALSPPLAAAVAAPLVLGLTVFAAALPSMVAHQRAQVAAGEELGRSAAAALTGHRDVTACGGQERVVAAVDRRVVAQADAERTLARMAALRSLSLGLGGWLPVVVLLLAAPWLVGRGLSTGAVLGALVYVTTGLQPALHALVQGVGGGGLRYAVTLDRILRGCPPTDPSAAAGRTAATAGGGTAGGGTAGGGTAGGATADGGVVPAVRVRGLTFRYGPHARPVLADFTLTVAGGEHLAVVGPSGAGKSTLAALIAGLVPPDSGSVHLADTPVAAVAPETLARLRVLVPQEAYVRSGTLADNLRYLRPDADQATVAAAVDALGAGPLVERLGGLAAEVEPGRLSAGERQLIAAVRAYLAPAPLVILDEATCHLDPTLEATVEEAFARRPGSLVVIAHRISSAIRARRVLVFDDDRPLAGSHEELLRRSPTYRELVGHWQELTIPAHRPLTRT
ncbi:MULTISPECIES: ATP-binding cassette domain-containing protein [Micromonospora]|uniref:Antibiotic ABC transporter ATP-binding protein n=1 Tax=Micromonospora maris TaxID=1003110 RepID=A0A9X0I1E8_9ACTN|nr:MULTISPECIES: ATP-binding cassette domain-containing protein [Micromonospora]AEB45645.1 ABC transporter-like protein [Micromonospora maris AB-18-032]KUJ44998.1 antibiotic ABC transporter ATP-binding protein [Micromonospora maris]RUL94954.1 ABC transporter ATP-binding protein [Verrucosispora sp. FIM060022]